MGRDDDRLTVFAYAENCTRAGQRRWPGPAEDADDLRERDNLVCFELTREQMQTLADRMVAAANADPAHADTWRLRVAGVLTDAAAKD